MKKILKMLGWIFLVVLFLSVAGGIYMYQSNPLIKAIVQNDESKLFYFPEKEISNLDMFEYEERFLQVEDSVKISTYVFNPIMEKATGQIFFIHGAGGNVTTYKTLIMPLVQNGYIVYAVDWRGYGNSTGVPTYQGVLKDTQVAYQDFVDTIVKSDTLKTIVYGVSLGGQLAVKIAKDNQKSIDGLVLDGSVESAQQIAMDFAPIDWLRERARKRPEKFNQDYVAIKDIQDIYNVPKLIIHSRTDREVPFSHGENLFAAAKEPKTFWETKTAHVMTLKDHPDESAEKLLELINQ